MPSNEASMPVSISLRPIEVDDTALVVAWRNDPAVRGNLVSQAPISADDHLTWMKRQVLTGKCAQFIICLSDGCVSTPIGTTFIKNIEREESRGEFGIFLGEETARGKGYSYEIMRQILDFGFDSLDLSQIYLTVFADNVPGIRAYEKMGFVVDESQTEIIDRPHGDGRLLYMSLDRDEYRRSQELAEGAESGPASESE